MVHDKATNKNVYLTPERVEAETPISEGEFVRISLEVPRAGHLYVLNREQYADGSFGAATLIFPTQRINQGRNRVLPGQVVQIPTQRDDPPYLTVRPNPDRNDQVAEVLTVLLTTAPLEVPVLEEAVQLKPEQVSEWEKRWTAPTERLELEAGAGRTRTRAERRASLNMGRLRQNEPPPQTLYRVDAKPNSPFLVDVRLLLKK